MAIIGRIFFKRGFNVAISGRIFFTFVQLCFFKKLKITTMACRGVSCRICDDFNGVALGSVTVLPSGGGSG